MVKIRCRGEKMEISCVMMNVRRTIKIKRGVLVCLVACRSCDFILANFG